MPPRAKFTKSQITAAALNIVREEGLSSLTARSLGDRLGSSARPIFTVFQSMDEVQQAVLDAAMKRYTAYIEQGLAEELSFRGVGKQYIRFAMEEPRLFQLLFMSEQKEYPELSGILPLIDSNYRQILLSIEKDYGLSGEAAENLYQHLWIYSHGIATLCVTKMCRFTDVQIENMLSDIGRSLILHSGGTPRSAPR